MRPWVRVGEFSNSEGANLRMDHHGGKVARITDATQLDPLPARYRQAPVAKGVDARALILYEEIGSLGIVIGNDTSQPHGMPPGGIGSRQVPNLLRAVQHALVCVQKTNCPKCCGGQDSCQQATME